MNKFNVISLLFIFIAADTDDDDNNSQSTGNPEDSIVCQGKGDVSQLGNIKI